MPRNSFVVWLLYISLCAYNFLDIYQTNLLFKLGAYEANPVLSMLMRDGQDIQTIIIVKCGILGFLGILLFLHQRAQRKNV